MNGTSATIHRLDLDGADRLTAVLMKAFEIGEGVNPLNSKRVQLQNLGPALEHLFQDLRREMTVLSATADAPDRGRACCARRWSGSPLKSPS